jgi:hypothetical protein
MQFTESDLRAAAAAGAIEPTQLERLLDFLAVRAASRTAEAPPAAGPKFDVAHLLWYAGALIVIGAMGMFSTLAFSQMGGRALTATAAVYAVIFAGAGHYLWHEKKLRTPGGLLIAIAVSMAPLAVYGVQDALGWCGQFGRPGSMHDFYIWIKGSWIFMEVAAILAAAIALSFYRFPFIVSIIAVALWFMSMDLAPWIAGSPYADYDTRRMLSIAFGVAMLAVAYGFDRRQRTGDFAFWLYLFGLLAFWGGISATSGGSNLAKAVYCAMNVGLLLIAVFLDRRVFAVFGVLGIAAYLGDLANKVFRDSLIFPFALSLIGVGVIVAGLYYHRHQAAIAAWLDARLPGPVKRLRPAHAR